MNFILNERVLVAKHQFKRGRFSVVAPNSVKRGGGRRVVCKKHTTTHHAFCAQVELRSVRTKTLLSTKIPVVCTSLGEVRARVRAEVGGAQRVDVEVEAGLKRHAVGGGPEEDVPEEPCGDLV